MRRLKFLSFLICASYFGSTAHAVIGVKAATSPSINTTTSNLPSYNPSGEVLVNVPTGSNEAMQYGTDSTSLSEAANGAQAAQDAAGAAQAKLDRSKAETESLTCINKADDARMACSTLSSLTGLGNTEGAMLEAIIMNQLPNLIGQLASSGKSAAQQCKIQADINKLVTTVSVLKSGACLMLMNSCRSTCGTALSKAKENINLSQAREATDPTAHKETLKQQKIVDEVRGPNDKCGGYKTNMAMMLAQAGLGLVNTMKSNQCADDLSETALMTPPPLSLTASNVDCSNPSFAATNMACICRSTPSDPMCAQFNAGPGNGAGGAGVVGGSVTTP
ncbi:MAG: hypothetical protein EOP05_15800, partial [Proteobacteria bacterium]